jgi:hypothetical protein
MKPKLDFSKTAYGKNKYVLEIQISLLKICNVYLKHFSIWWIFDEMQKKISASQSTAICVYQQGDMKNSKEHIWKMYAFYLSRSVNSLCNHFF